MFIFIDDKRQKPAGYDKCFRNAEDFYNWLDDNEGTYVYLLSLDYYLNDENIEHETGLDIAKKLTERNHSIKKVQIHSNYLDGAKEIYRTLTNYKKDGKNINFVGCFPKRVIIEEDGTVIAKENLR